MEESSSSSSPNNSRLRSEVYRPTADAFREASEGLAPGESPLPIDGDLEWIKDEVEDDVGLLTVFGIVSR